MKIMFIWPHEVKRTIVIIKIKKKKWEISALKCNENTALKYKCGVEFRLRNILVE